MPEYKRPPKVGSITVRCLIDDERVTRTGPNLDAALRGVLIRMKTLQGVSTRKLAQRLGISQQGLSGALSDDDSRGFTLTMVSRIAAASQLSIGKLFALHPSAAFSLDSSDEAKAWDAVKSVTSESQRQRLISALMLAQTLDISEAMISQFHSTTTTLAKQKELDLKQAEREAKRLAC